MRLMLKKHVKCKKKNIYRFVMAEWDRLVEHCSNDLPVQVSEKLIDGTFQSCFCCVDSPSMEVMNLPCCKTSVHRHCVLEALQTSKQQSMCLLQESSGSSRYYWLYSPTQGILRRGKHFPNHYTYRNKGTPRGKHVRRGKHFTNNYTSRIKGTTCPRKKYLPTWIHQTFLVSHLFRMRLWICMSNL